MSSSLRIITSWTILAAVVFAAADAQSPDSVMAVRKINLRDAIALALTNSPTILDARYSLQIADAQVKEAWSSVLPTVSTTGSYQRSIEKQKIFLPADFSNPGSGELIPIEIGSDNTWNAGVSVAQPIFDMRAFIGVGASARVRQLQEEMVRGTAQTVVTTVRQGYLNALLAVEQVYLLEKSVERVRQSMDEARVLHQSGLASEYDVLRLEVQLSNLDAQLHQAIIRAAAARRNLLGDLGLPTDTDLEFAGHLSSLDLRDKANNTDDNLILLEQIGFGDDNQPEFATVYSQALNDHSNIRQQDITIDLGRAQLRAQRAQYFPTLSVFYNHSLSAQEDSIPDFFGDSSERVQFAVAGVNLQFDIFTGFARGARIQQRKVAIRQSQLRKRQLELSTDTQLRTLLEDLDDTRYRVASRLRAVEQAQRGFEIASAEFRNGLSSQLQVTDAEVALKQSEFNYSSTVFEYLLVRTRLDAAIGAAPSDPLDLTNNSASANSDALNNTR